MNKEQILKKLTSRKFLLTLFLLVFGILCVTKVIPIDLQEQWKGIFIISAAVIAYIFGEGATDIAGIIKENKEESEEYANE